MLQLDKTVASELYKYLIKNDYIDSDDSIAGNIIRQRIQGLLRHYLKV
ncbi:MAG: hypothetical protein LBE09_05655 [Christensenellaceae bacterium]|nr:hypothetical protein [Christensenellaceae bacterium]